MAVVPNIGYPNCNGIRSVATTFDDDTRSVDHLPLNQCFHLIRYWNIGPGLVILFGKVESIAGNHKLKIWKDQDCAGDPAKIENLEEATDQIIAVNMVMSIYGSPYTTVNVISVQIKGFIWDKEAHCGFAQWRNGRGEDIFQFMATCFTETIMTRKTTHEKYWPGYWIRQECVDSKVQGFRYLTQSLCQRDPNMQKTEWQTVQEVDDSTFAGGNRRLVTCTPAPEGGQYINPTPVVHRWENADPEVGCVGDIAEYREYIAIFPDSSYGTGTENYRKTFWSYMVDMQLDKCNFMMGSKGFNLIDAGIVDVGGWLKHGDFVNKSVCAACIEVFKRAEGGFIVRWSLSSDKAEYIEPSADQDYGEKRFNPTKYIDSGFDDNPLPGGFMVRMESNILVDDKRQCGMNANNHANFTTVYGGQGVDLFNAVKELEADQCEFWMNNFIHISPVGDEGLAETSAVCVGCFEVVSRGFAGVEIKSWISGLTKANVDAAEIQMRENVGNPPTAVQVSVTMNGRSTQYDLELVSNTKTGAHQISGPTCESTANARITVITTFTGDAETLIDYWNTMGMDQCIQWMKQVLDLGAGGWRAEDRVCTGCTEVKRGSATMKWWISSDQQSSIESFRTKIEQGLTGKQITVETVHHSTLIIQMQNSVIPPPGNSPNGGPDGEGPDGVDSLPNSGGDDDVSTLPLALGLGLGGFVLCVFGLAIAYWLWRRSSNAEAPREAANGPVDEAANVPVDEAVNVPMDEAANVPVDEAANGPVDEAAHVPVDEAALEDVTSVTIQEIQDENRVGAI